MVPILVLTSIHVCEKQEIEVIKESRERERGKDQTGSMNQAKYCLEKKKTS